METIWDRIDGLLSAARYVILSDIKRGILDGLKRLHFQ